MFFIRYLKILKQIKRCLWVFLRCLEQRFDAYHILKNTKDCRLSNPIFIFLFSFYFHFPIFILFSFSYFHFIFIFLFSFYFHFPIFILFSFSYFHFIFIFPFHIAIFCNSVRLCSNIFKLKKAIIILMSNNRRCQNASS